MDGFTHTFAGGARTIVFLLLPSAAISIALAEPITRLLFQHSKFTASDTTHVAMTLVAFSLGLIGNGLSLLLTRAFFALQMPQVPTRVAVVNLVLNAVLDLALYKPFGAAGIALSTAVVTTFNATVLFVLLRRQVGSLHLAEVAAETARIVVATVYCTAAAFGVWWPLDQILGRSLPAQIVSVGLALAAGGAAYLAAGRILQLSDMAVLGSLADRMRGRATA
jgi:putative peptidoglycan lipid II flippase